MPYLTAVATVDAGYEYTVYVMMALSWQEPIDIIPWWYRVGTDGFATGVGCRQLDEDVDAGLTSWAQRNGWEVRRGWAHTQFGVQAHVGYAAGNDYRLPTPRSYVEWRQEQERLAGGRDPE